MLPEYPPSPRTKPANTKRRSCPPPRSLPNRVIRTPDLSAPQVTASDSKTVSPRISDSYNSLYILTSIFSASLHVPRVLLHLENVGAVNSGNNRDFVSAAIGFRSRLTEAATCGVAYDIPLTDDRDSLMKDRVTVDLLWTF